MNTKAIDNNNAFTHRRQFYARVEIENGMFPKSKATSAIIKEQ